MKFRPIEITDREAITAFTLNSPYQNCDFAFANICSWRFLYESEFAIDDDVLYLRFNINEKGHRHLAYMFPVTQTFRPVLIKNLEADAAAHNFPLLIFGITPEIQALLNESFTCLHDRAHYDYIYLRTDLATLTGKKYQPKRNHINRFVKLYDYEYLDLNAEMTDECMAVEQKWFADNDDAADHDDLAHERQAMCYAMKHFNQLGIIGGAIRVDGKIVAFTYGSPVNNNTFAIHVEKADIAYEGVFSLINRDFAARLPEKYVYINREEDLGIPGLRQAKLSYHPTLILEKNAAIKRR
ncbi:MAG: phosphatidylglycerol lysyltransferase domain-containing protein [Tannerella sp.]|jgi:hypothetical protein|nr:phosphatidylglycerol lysyltransferase domain-containing protein [Tannerella sp.]